MKHTSIILPLISVIILTSASCNQDYFTYDGKTWGTTYHIVYKSEQEQHALIDSCLRAIDEELSMFNPASTVSAINRGATTRTGADFDRVFELCVRVNKWSEGHYDPTLGALSQLWGFGNDDMQQTPSDSAIAVALASVGIADCRLKDGNITKKAPGTVFDFSSVAKGYGIDRIADAFGRHGIDNYLIEIGGEVLVKGNNPKGRPWRVQVDSPVGGMTHAQLIVAELGPQKTAMASSGNYRNYRRDEQGNIYGHTLSPLTGRPARSCVIAATVIAPDCALADALATACMAAPDDTTAWRIIERADVPVEALLVVATPDGSLAVSTSAGFNKYIQSHTTPQ